MKKKSTLENAYNRIDGQEFAYGAAIGDIMARLAEARERYVEICAAMDALEAAGTWPAIPTFTWESRANSDGRYLRLRWHRTKGGYDGPDGAKSTYIGAGPKNIADAIMKAQNRTKWEHLDMIRTRLRRWLLTQATDLRRIARFAEHYKGHALDLAQYKPTRREEVTLVQPS